MKPFAFVRQIAVTAVVFALVVTAHADTWQYEAKISVKEFSFGNIRIALQQDATQDQQYPNYLLTIYNGGTEVARYPGLAFQTIQASPDKKIFVGLSNEGVPGSAVIVFDSLGVISLFAKHGLAEFDYCQKSVTQVRTWYDEDNPEVEFRIGGNKDNPGIYLRSCRGTRIELIQTVASSYARAAENVGRK